MARVEKILDTLEDIPSRISGFSVHAYRVRGYKKLIQQRPDLMAKHTERWFKVTIKSALSVQKDLSQNALDALVCAAKTLGHDRVATRSVLAVLNRAKDDGSTFAHLVAEQLKKMLDTDHAALAPQIWAAVTAFLKDNLQVTTFPATKEWLYVLQSLCNSDNELVKVHASVALNFFIYAVNINQHTPPIWIKMILQLVKQQMQHLAHAKKSEAGPATSGYLTLLYYSLRPDAPAEQLDRYWNEFVVDFWQPRVHLPSSRWSVAACRVVSSLLKGSRRPWNEQRALELKPQMTLQREELPLLDPQWVRKSLGSILRFVETLVDSTPWTSGTGDNEPSKTVWIALLDSLVEASSKEVMASGETKDAIAQVVNSLRRIWDRHTTKLALPQQKEDIWANKFCGLMEQVVEKLGAFQFAEKCLTRNTNDEFEVAPTPSQRSRQHGPRISPLLFFLELLVNQSEGRLLDEVRLRAVDVILEPCLAIQKTRLGKLELLRDCALAVSPAPKTPVLLKFWSHVALLAKSCLNEQLSDPNERLARTLGKEYDLVVDITVSGCSLLESVQAQEFFGAFVEAVRREAGEGAVVLSVVEKVSECLLRNVPDADTTACLPYVSILLRNLPATINRRILEQGRQSLWPSSSMPARAPEFDPYNHFYLALSSVGSKAYNLLDVQHIDATRDFLAGLTTSISTCPISLLAIYLRRIQAFVSLWVEDPDRKLETSNHNLKSLHQEVVSLWRVVCAAIERLLRKDSSLLLALEPLIASGFKTRRHGIINISVASWDTTFAKEQTLRYPARIEEILQRLRNHVDISLPSLPPTTENFEAPSLYNSDSGEMDAGRKPPSLRVRESPLITNRTNRKSRSPPSTTGSRRKASARIPPRVRLRHDDSQIQFEPVASSPSNPFNQESQILTERQRDMVDRQRVTANLFSSMGPTNGPQQDAAPRFNSDPVSGDDLPTERSRTPLRPGTSLGPIDIYLGSSPTPHSRNRSQQILSDNTDVATPSAVRAMQLNNETEELSSSPPRFEKQDQQQLSDVIMSNDTNDDFIGDSFEYRQTEKALSSFEDGNTEDVLQTAEVATQEDLEDDLPTDNGSSGAQSSTVELELTAQFDADINARKDPSVDPPLVDANVEAPRELDNAVVSTLPPRALSEVRSPSVEVSTEGGSNDTSRVEDSFLLSTPHGQHAEKAALPTSNLRRSSRVSTTPNSEQQNNSSKRKRSPIDVYRKPTKQKKTETSAPNKATSEQAESTTSLAPGDDPDCIVVEMPKKRRGRPSARRASRGPSDTPPSQRVVPGLTRKRSITRPCSQLSTSHLDPENVLVEDTPAPKRSRTHDVQDASAARHNTVRGTPRSQPKRLSHVQVTPKRSSSVTSGRGLSTTPAEEGSTIDENLTGPKQALPAGDMQNVHVAPQAEGGTENVETEKHQSKQASLATGTPSRSFSERVILTPRSIIETLKGIKAMISGAASQFVLGRQEEREADDLLFEIRRGVHAAARRGGEGD
ncbi:hypothetical protein EJ04DRAFT_508569 [Polyplosphaeria fusca]|uniref:Telomere-associated protein Rif1 N-terminal domain-containing protein n=1 Tax=Polyplosphaeria fusca TaxID=682080 RepID=A0A9P4V6D2_9PLEO|nr:hypothetical protein EJ04DRAFT_508569 [Polyplosphaeria fusca]